MKLSIITINYNNAKGLKETIKSVVCQDFKDYEYIIIDGGSTDESVQIIKKYSQFITYWVSEKDNGIYNAMNKGVRYTHGTYCLFMNSGDIIYNKNVLKNIFSKKYDMDIITGVTIGKNENDIRFSTEGKVTFLTLYRSTISHQSSFIRTTLLRKYPYNEHLRIVSDWEFWIKTIILNDCTHIFVNDIVAKINLEGISITNSEEREKERSLVLKDMIPSRIIADYEPLKFADDNLIRYVAKISKTYRIRKLTSFILHSLYRLLK